MDRETARCRRPGRNTSLAANLLRTRTKETFRELNGRRISVGYFSRRELIERIERMVEKEDKERGEKEVDVCFSSTRAIPALWSYFRRR